MDGNGLIGSNSTYVDEQSSEIHGKALLEREFYNGGYPTSTIAGVGDAAGMFNAEQSIKVDLATAVQNEAAIMKEVGTTFTTVDQINTTLEI